ncbi:uncharacterized protein [Physcomitrium patens]|uniref:uncharacterized protein isoform X1 n=2 Tax=Physcomitrium patens TaxID=3218 RepID=UPI000D176BBE|nr:uncharacterized protein LOC112290709 isoform X1 [Physcomitrium patens]XP_024393085.1 uncharacterized protein LOC112290709 isoform X1 [Physcomitrium patens]XP_024393086.1 uncharacterized protein LOC112290709 isoform X1 [Physcomitrium patens]|eukprot:XP_024393084.1 uncharacterized protein LOC112290709 isoform X1 [Physcomitrella patens]
MAKMQPSAPRDILQGVHNSVTDMVKDVANEPSVGLYFVQQHVHKAVPGLLALKSQIVEEVQEVMLYTEDVRDALTSVKTMKEVGPPVFSKMIATLNASLQLLPTLHHPVKSSRRPIAHLPRSATHHGALPFSGLQQETKHGIPLEGAILEGSRESSSVLNSVKEFPFGSSRLSSSQWQDNGNLPSTQAETSGYVSSLFNSAYQRASSVTMSMPSTLEAKDRDIVKQGIDTNVSVVPNLPVYSASTPGSHGGYIPNIPYWNVLESAIQKAGHIVGAGGIRSGSTSDSSRKPSLVRSFSAVNLRESAHEKPGKPSLETADTGVTSATRLDAPINSNDTELAREHEEQRLPGITESQTKLADWLRLPSTALRNLSRREGTESDGRADQFDLQNLPTQGDHEQDEEPEHPELDLEEPEVVEGYAKLQAEQAAKLEAWLEDSKEEEAPSRS